MSAFFGWFAGLWFRFVRAGNAFWSLLLHLAAQVHAPGVGDVASTWTSRAALAVGRFGNAFWSLLLQLATQVRVPGAGDAAVTWTSRAALRWGVIPLSKKGSSFFCKTLSSIFRTPCTSPGLTGGQFLGKSAILRFCSIYMEFYL